MASAVLNTVAQALADSSDIPTKVGDIIVYESISTNVTTTSTTGVAKGGGNGNSNTKWRWAVGEVLGHPTSRTTEVRLWRKKERLLDMSEQAKSDQLRHEISQRQEELERERQLILGDQDSILAQQLRAQEKSEAAAVKLFNAQTSIADAQHLIGAVTDKQWAEVRGYVSPPTAVRLVLESVLLLLDLCGQQPSTNSGAASSSTNSRPSTAARPPTGGATRVPPSTATSSKTAAAGSCSSAAAMATAVPWRTIQTHLRGKDFLRHVNHCTVEGLREENVTRIERDYLPQLPTAVVRRSSQAAVALHAWVAAMCECLGAVKEVARVQEEVVVLAAQVADLGEDANSNFGKMRALEKDIKRLEDELEALFDAEKDDMLLMNTLSLNTARGGGMGDNGSVTARYGGTMSDIDLAQKSEFYSTLEAKVILSCQIFANLENDVDRCDTVVDGKALGQTMTIDPIKVLMTARGGGFATSRGGLQNSGGANKFATGSTLPEGFQLKLPTSISALPSAAAAPSSASLQSEVDRLKKANAEAEATIASLKASLAKAEGRA